MSKRYIDADALIKEIEDCSYETWSKDVNRTWWAQAVKVKDNIKQCIERQPAADAVGVVRCKDCVHWTDTSCDSRVTEAHWGECRKPLGDYRYCETAENDYCSYGERRDDGK